MPQTAATYVGITNENEFYSHHYLSEVFRGDIKELIQAQEAREKEGDGTYKAPHSRLRALARDYFATREQWDRERGLKRRIELQRDFFGRLLAALGYDYHPQDWALDAGAEIPILARAGQPDQPPQLLALGAVDASEEGSDPLSLCPDPHQFHGDVPPDPEILRASWNDIISRRLFGLPRPPRWVLLLSDRQLLLIDRFKWNQNRALRFDWDEILGRRDDATLKATAVLLHRNSLVPGGGASLLDGLDENAHRHAFAVSEDLKYALREAIELLGNEAARQLIAQAARHKKGIYSGAHGLDAGRLSLECLRYMYRLLFLFYIEARPELGYVPINRSEVYTLGYTWSTCATWSWCGSTASRPVTGAISTSPSSSCSG